MRFELFETFREILELFVVDCVLSRGGCYDALEVEGTGLHKFKKMRERAHF
jgi:hypothetical protein